MANLIQMAYELCTAIEECGASEKLTASNLKAYELYKAVKEIRALIADDAYAISFQSMGQYRTAILKTIDGPPYSPEQAPLAKTQVNAMQRLGRISVSSSTRAEASLSFSCAKRAADPGNEFSACRQWCGDAGNCPSTAGHKQRREFDVRLFHRHVDNLSDMSEEERDSAPSFGADRLTPELLAAIYAVNQTETRVRHRASLSRASSSRAEVEQIVPMSEQERNLFRDTVNEIEDCGETSTDYAQLMVWAQRGLLECQHFVTTKAGKALLAAQPAEDARASRQHCTRCEYIGRCDCEPKSADTRQGVALSNPEPALVVVSRFVTDETDAYLDKLRFAASEAIRTFEDAGDAMSWSPTIDAIERLKGILHGGYEYHSDDAAVDAFAWAMRDKMEESREKGRSGWDSPFQCSPERLAEMLIDHISKGDPVDVGNFAMMLFNRPDARGVLAKVWEARASSSQGVALSDENAIDDLLASIPEVCKAERAVNDFDLHSAMEQAFRAIARRVLSRASSPRAEAQAVQDGGALDGKLCEHCGEGHTVLTFEDGQFASNCGQCCADCDYFMVERLNGMLAAAEAPKEGRKDA